MTADNDNLSAIMGSTTTVRTMADGTLRLTVDIEPRHARDAFTLFGAPGTPIAMARMTSEAAVAESRRGLQRPEPTPEPQKGGALCKLAAIFCASDEFRLFLAHQLGRPPSEVADPADIIRKTCGIESRAELDHNPEAAKLFHSEFRLPYQAWQQGRGRA